jgi:hypothetical protein
LDATRIRAFTSHFGLALAAAGSATLSVRRAVASAAVLKKKLGGRIRTGFISSANVNPIDGDGPTTPVGE